MAPCTKPLPKGMSVEDSFRSENEDSRIARVSGLSLRPL